MRALAIVLPVLNGVAVFILGASRVAWPSATFWQHWIILSLAAAAATPVVQTAVSEGGERRRRKELERDERIRTLLAPSFVVLARDCGAPWDKMGIQAFLLTSWGKRRRHVRISKIRLSSAPSSGVRWTKDKGVIGRCWESRREQWEQLDSGAFQRLSGVPEYQWKMQDPNTTFGLTYAEYKTIGTKYGTIAAVPIISSSDKYIGCITLDTPVGICVQDRTKALESLTATADIVRRVIEAVG